MTSVYKKCLTIACVLCLLFFEVQGQALSDTVRTEVIQEVTVYAVRGSDVSSVSAAKSADRKLMEAASALQISDVLKYFSGATVKDYGGIGGLKTVSVRGLGATHTAVAYDGVIITDNQTGQIDLGRFSASRTESVRLVSGPDNDLLQTAAMAAQAAALTVNSYRPRLETGKAQCNAEVKYGSFNTVSALAGVDLLASRNNTLSLQTEWLKTDGDYPYIQDNAGSSQRKIRDNSNVRRLRAEAALFSTLTDNTELSVRGYWFQSEQGLPANILYNDNAAREHLWNRNGFAQASLKTYPAKRMTLLFNAKYGESYTRYLNPGINNSMGKLDNRYNEQEGYLSGVLLYRLAERLSASVAADGRYSRFDNGNGDEQARPARLTLNSSSAVKYASERTVLTARLNHVVTAEKTLLSEATRNYNNLSPVIGVNWTALPAAGLHLRASYSTTYRLPTFNDLYFEQIGRRDLRPEKGSVKSIGAVIGHETEKLAISLYADLFDSSLTDRIMAVPGKNTAVWMMKNIGCVVTHGVESGLEIESASGKIRPAVNLSYTYQRSMDKSDKTSYTWNHQLPYTPRHSASAVVWVVSKWLNMSANWLYSGEYFSNSYNGPEYRMPAYYEIGCSLWREFNLRDYTFTVQSECINLTDSRYELVRNYPMPGRQFRLKLKIAL